jgi:hypothetical protein
MFLLPKGLSALDLDNPRILQITPHISQKQVRDGTIAPTRKDLEENIEEGIVFRSTQLDVLRQHLFPIILIFILIRELLAIIGAEELPDGGLFGAKTVAPG